MKTDRELLELAARAAGISGFVYSFPGMLERYGFNEAIYDDASDSHWNPLYDDGDALRLAVKLKISMEFFDGLGEIRASDDSMEFSANEKHGSDLAASTRRAIVRAAAAIGEQMK